MAYRNVYFHRLNLYFFTANSDKEGPTQKYLNKEQLQTKFKDILKYLKSKNKMEYKVNGKHTVTFNFMNGVDNFLNSKSTIITGKLSRPRDYHSYQKRDKKSNAIESVATENELFEARSYFSIDLENGIISFLLGESVAPRVFEFSSFIEKITEEIPNMQKFFGEVTDLVEEDGLKILSEKQEIGSIYYSMELPANLPIEKTGIVNINEYKKLREQDHIRIDIGYIANRKNKSSFSKTTDVIEFFKSLMKKENVKKVSAKAKNADENRMTNVKLVNNPFIKKVDFSYSEEDTDEKFEEVIQSKLSSVYHDNLNEINDYLG